MLRGRSAKRSGTSEHAAGRWREVRKSNEKDDRAEAGQGRRAGGFSAGLRGGDGIIRNRNECHGEKCGSRKVDGVDLR